MLSNTKANKIDRQLRCAIVVAMHKIVEQRERPLLALQKIVAGKVCAFSDRDLASQEAFIRVMSRRFPTLGWFCEENNFVKPSEWPGHDVRIVLDSLDGSVSEIRDDGFGVGVMVSLVVDGQIVASYVGNADSGAVIGFGPGSPDVFMWRDADFSLDGINLSKRRFASSHLSDHKVLLRREADAYERPLSGLLRSTDFGGVFSRALILSGSIGLNFTHLWRGGAVAIALPRSNRVEPWDAIPLLGINQRLNMAYVQMQDGALVEFVPDVSWRAIKQPNDVVVIRRSFLPAFQAAVSGL